MAPVNFRALERRSYAQRAEETGLQLTPELLGQAVACALQVYAPDKQAVAPGVFERVFLSGSVPESIRRVLHVENVLGGRRIGEATRMAVAPQSAGIAGRLNPDNASLVPKTDALQAYSLLSYYASRFPEEIEWIKNTVAHGLGSETAVHTGVND